MTTSLTITSLSDLAIKLLLACVMGFLLGYDRKQKDKPLGYQSFMVIMVTTTLVAIMGEELYAEFSSADDVIQLDLGKIIAGTLTGIGFLGAGAIIKRGEETIIGTTTGASIWAAGGLGLMLGFGFYALAFAGFVTIWLILALGAKLQL